MKNPDDLLIASVGARVKHLRLVAGHTQSDMAARMGVSLRNYQRLETGDINMSLRTVARLAEALAVEPASLFSEILPCED